MDTPGGPEHDTRRSSAAPLIALAATLAALVAALIWVAHITREPIALNRQSRVSAALEALLPPGSYDNDVLADTIEVRAPELLGTEQPVVVYRVRKDGRPVAAVLRPVAPDGYRGPIELMVAIAYDGTIIGVQVLRHNETPGLGAQFETRRADWLDAFAGLSLSNPPQQRWTVRKDGGDFDAFTGATITPRAIVKAVRRTLEFYHTNRERLYE
ncbi:MAG: electron transport complex subunit RsxG [Gammaproteobacteria bacterium]|nr:electron transport complex subunit RsxG [Gammaproteobacteria bacterium]